MRWCWVHQFDAESLAQMWPTKAHPDQPEATSCPSRTLCHTVSLNIYHPNHPMPSQTDGIYDGSKCSKTLIQIWKELPQAFNLSTPMLCGWETNHREHHSTASYSIKSIQSSQSLEKDEYSWIFPDCQTFKPKVRHGNPTDPFATRMQPQGNLESDSLGNSVYLARFQTKWQNATSPKKNDEHGNLMNAWSLVPVSDCMEERNRNSEGLRQQSKLTWPIWSPPNIPLSGLNLQTRNFRQIIVSTIFS